MLQLLHQCIGVITKQISELSKRTIYAVDAAFERLELRSETESPMQKKANITMLYEPGPADLNSSSKSASTKLPILHVGYAQHILCRAPLIPAFLDGSATNTIPITKGRGSVRDSAFPYGKTDSRAGAGVGR